MDTARDQLARFRRFVQEPVQVPRVVEWGFWFYVIIACVNSISVIARWLP